MKHYLLSLSFILGLTLICSIEAMACSCAFGGGAPCQEFWRVNAVFAGTVVGSGKISVELAGSKYDQRLVHFTVDQPIRGMQSTEVDVITGWGDADCGYGFKMGQRYLVYAYRDEKNHSLSTSICTRTRLLTEADDDFAFIKSLPGSGQNGLVFGVVGKRNYELKEGENWYKPVAGAEVLIEGESTKYEAQSDNNGKFRVENVLPGKYVVKLKLPPGLIRNLLQKDEGAKIVEDEIEVAARGCAESDFYLESDTRVTGRVLDARGNPVAKLNLNMRATGAKPQPINSFLYATTDANGNFEFTTVPPGEFWLGYHLLSEPLQEGQHYGRTYLPGVSTRALATVLRVKEGQTINGLTLQMPEPLSDRTISGIVVSAEGNPVSGATVNLSLTEEGEPSAASSTVTGESGEFTAKLWAGLPYKISAYRQLPERKYLQSEFIDVPLALERPMRLVLPAQPRN